MTRLFVCIILLLSGITAGAQTLKQLTSMGDKFAAEGNLYGAVYYYGLAVERDSSKMDILYKYADALRLYHDYAKAAYYYNSIYRRDRGRTFPEAQYWLATMQKNLGDYRRARRNFRVSLTKHRRDKEGYMYRKISQELAATASATEKIRRDSSGVKIINAKDLNDTQSDFGAVPVGDSMVYFSSLRTGSTSTISMDSMPRIALFSANKDKENPEWDKPSALKIPGVSAWSHVANPSVTADGNRIYFSQCEGNTCTIMMAGKKDGKWTAAEPLNEVVNKPYSNNTQPHYSRLFDGREVLFFVSDRNGPAKRLDIWYAWLDENGQPTEAINAGENINTPDDEITPFYDSINRKLYFSSTWHEGIGGFDIFMSRGEPGNFSAPYNLAVPFNSTANDFYFSVTGKGNKGYLASNRAGSMVVTGETCCNDLYWFTAPEDTTPPPPTVVSTMEELRKYLPLTLYFNNDEPNPRSVDTVTSLTYLESFNNYMPSKRKYMNEYSKGLKDMEEEEARVQMESFFEDEVARGADDLQRFASLLKEALENGFEINLTIKGYASTLAESDYNVNLTKRRISSLKNFIARYENGVFLPYLADTAANGAFLIYTEIPYGEHQAAEEVSDNLQDLKSSVYSISAARERKIEILAVQVTDSVNTGMSINGEASLSDTIIHNLGDVRYSQIRTYDLTIHNRGTTPMRLTDSETNCGCTVAELPTSPVPAGGKAIVKVTFNSAGKYGEVINLVKIKTSGRPETVVLQLRANVVMGD